jgi:hypothetical protein
MPRLTLTLLLVLLVAIFSVGGCPDKSVTGPQPTATEIPFTGTLTSVPTDTRTPPPTTVTPPPPTLTETFVPTVVVTNTPTIVANAPDITRIELQADPLHPGFGINVVGTGFDATSTFTLEGTSGVITLVILRSVPGIVQVGLPLTTPPGTYLVCVRTSVAKDCFNQDVTVAP